MLKFTGRINNIANKNEGRGLASHLDKSWGCGCIVKTQRNEHFQKPRIGKINVFQKNFQISCSQMLNILNIHSTQSICLAQVGKERREKKNQIKVSQIK